MNMVTQSYTLMVAVDTMVVIVQSVALEYGYLTIGDLGTYLEMISHGDPSYMLRKLYCIILYKL